MQVAATLAVGEAVSSTATDMNPATFHQSLPPSLRLWSLSTEIFIVATCLWRRPTTRTQSTSVSTIKTTSSVPMVSWQPLWTTPSLGLDRVILTQPFSPTCVCNRTHLHWQLVCLCAGECVSYNDLNRLDWLFKGKGDIQFDVYRQMKEVSKWVDKDCRLSIVHDCVDGETVGFPSYMTV